VANLRKVAAAISMMDDNVGAMTTRISHKQLLDRTLVVFTATAARCSAARLWAAGDASEPVNMYDESVAVPMLCAGRAACRRRKCGWSR